MTDEAITGIEPEAVWRHFAAISARPHCSGNEEKVQKYIIETAARLGLEHERDAVGNVIVRKAAAPGRGNGVSVVLQAHVDMVCEKRAGSTHDFANDPIRLVREDDWIAADGTTLGADNGIGAALAPGGPGERGHCPRPPGRPFHHWRGGRSDRRLRARGGHAAKPRPGQPGFRG